MLDLMPALAAWQASPHAGVAPAEAWQASLLAGVLPEEAQRLHSPTGLDLGAVTPAEVAVSITAELVASRNHSARGLSLKHGSGPIHQFAGPGRNGTPEALTPEALTPKAVTPEALTPQAVAPDALTPNHQEMPWT